MRVDLPLDKKTVENQDWATGPQGRGPLGRPGPWAARLLLAKPLHAGNRAGAKSSKFDSSSMIHKRKLINDVEEFLERLVLHATREVSVYLYNFV